MYVTFGQKSACIHSFWPKPYMYMWLLAKNLRMYVTFGQKPAYTEKTVVKRRPRVKPIKGSVDGWTYYKMQHRNKEKQRASQEYQAHYAPNPKEKQGTSPVWPPILLRRKLPMAWGVPKQIEKLQKSISSPYAREIKHLTLKDLESYLILDGWSRSPLSFFQSHLRWQFTLNNSKEGKHAIEYSVKPTLVYIINDTSN